MVLAAARRHGLQPAIHLEPYAGRTPASVGERRRRTSRRSGSATSTSTTRATSPAADWAALRPQLPPSLRLFAGTRARRLRGGGPVRRLLHVRLHRTSAERSSRGSAPRRTRCTSSARRPSARDYDGRPGRRVGRAGLAERTVRRTTTSGRRRSPRIRTSSRSRRYNEWGEGTQIEPAQAKRGYNGVRRRLGADRRCGGDGLSDAHGVLGRALPRRLRDRILVGDGRPRRARTARPAAECADARPPRC